LATQIFLKSNAGLGVIYILKNYIFKKITKMIRYKPNHESTMDQREEDLLKNILSYDGKRKRGL